MQMGTILATSSFECTISSSRHLPSLLHTGMSGNNASTKSLFELDGL